MEHPTGTTRPTTCTCCGRRSGRQLVQVRVSAHGVPEYTAVCPHCDLQPAELQGWLTALLDGSVGD